MRKATVFRLKQGEIIAMERIVQQVEFRTPKKIKLLRVAAYARVSNGKDAMLHSLSAQVSYYNTLIQGNP